MVCPLTGDPARGGHEHMTGARTREEALHQRQVDPIPNLIARATAWACPWWSRTFPGFRVHIAQISGRSWRTVRHWRDGTRTPSPEALDILADAIELRTKAGQDIVKELRRIAAARRRQPRHHTGFKRAS